MRYELDNGRSVNIPDKDIERLQNTLKISYNEAVYTWLVDEGYFEDETVEELTEKAKKNRITATVHQAKAENSAKKERKPRERKVNSTKQGIIRTIFYALQQEYGDFSEITITNDEKYIEIVRPEGNFTINLVQHRAKKEK
jgi:predicted NAD-dependent protein-ADP-ribosyltransferase YbiA (DUF1768 family)